MANNNQNNNFSKLTGAMSSGSQGAMSRPVSRLSVSDIIDKLPSLSINIDKVFKLSSEDKIQVWKMVDEIIAIYTAGESQGYSPGQLLKLKLIYNTLHNSDYLCTKRDKNLANILDNEQEEC